MIASWTQIYYTNLSKQRKLWLKLHIARKFNRPSRRLIDWRIDSLLAAGFETQNIPRAPPLQFALQKTKETTRTLCRGNFPEILTIAGFKSTIDIVGGKKWAWFFNLMLPESAVPHYIKKYNNNFTHWGDSGGAKVKPSYRIEHNFDSI